MFEDEFLKFYKRKIDEIKVKCKVKIPIPAICIPMQNQRFVDSNGNYFFCEKMNEYDNFGNVRDGINYKKVYNYYLHYVEKFIEECNDCWAKRFCKLCFISREDGKEGDSIKKRKKACLLMKKELINSFVSYSEILEENTTAFEFYK